MRLIDTHCHLDFPDYGEDLDRVIERAASRGVTRMIVPGINAASSEKAIEIAGRHHSVFAAVGMHPHEADRSGPDVISRLRDLCINSDKVVAVGEIGLDYYRKHSRAGNQRDLFRQCLDISKELDLPLILHNREAGRDLLEILRASAPRVLKGVVHCFSGDKRFLEEILALGLHISFTGSITFERPGKLKELIELVPPERLLLETDSPYMSPVPLRGKRNEPANVRYLLDVYAGAYGLRPEDVARVTTHNANRLFRLGLEEKSKVAYSIRDSLYLNITNRCTNRCTFCTRGVSDYVKGHNLKLAGEPLVDEIISYMGDIRDYKEIVFCGFGEPTVRLGAVKRISAFAKEKGKKVRLVTNGEGDLINGRPVARELKGLIDTVSVSLNAPDAGQYAGICRPVFGEGAFDSIIVFIRECREQGMDVEVTCLDLIPEQDVSQCRAIAEGLGARFRVRRLNVVG